MVNFYAILEKQVGFCKFYAYPITALCVNTTEEHFKTGKVPENRTTKSVFCKNAKRELLDDREVRQYENSRIGNFREKWLVLTKLEGEEKVINYKSRVNIGVIENRCW